MRYDLTDKLVQVFFLKREKLLSLLPTVPPLLQSQRQRSETPFLLLVLDINKNNGTQSAEIYVFRSKKHPDRSIRQQRREGSGVQWTLWIY